MNDTNIKKVTEELHNAFHALNSSIFNNRLPEPAITIQSGGKRSTKGWFTNVPIWRNKEGDIKKYEINIVAAEYLNIGYLETIHIILHQMIHLYCMVNQIKDTSRNGEYHNSRFKEICLKYGLYFKTNSPDKRKGWYATNLSDEVKSLTESFSIDRTVFTLARDTYGNYKHENDSELDEEHTLPKKKKSNSIKWICPVCGVSVRSTKEVNIMCGDCRETMEAEIE
jgi:rubrerythrin